MNIDSKVVTGFDHMHKRGKGKKNARREAHQRARYAVRAAVRAAARQAAADGDWERDGFYAVVRPLQTTLS